MKTFHARTVEEVQTCVREHADARRRGAGDVEHRGPLRPVAGRSKTALSGGDGVMLDTSAIAGVIDYQPDECTFTARAATRVDDVEAMLAARGQYLPFEPPFATRGATLGGTVAAALSGPGRLRYGGVRDFLLGVRFVDGEARVIRGGGRVVKNAAGFYFQHLLLGSLGTLGVLTELTFKVFPTPRARATLVADHETLAAAIDTLSRLRRSTFELEAAELIPPGRLLLRLGGSPTALASRVDKLSDWLHAAGAAAVHQIADADEEQRCWHEARELTWALAASVPAQAPAPAATSLVKVSTTLGRVAQLDQRLADASGSGGGSALRRFGAGGDVAWIAWPHALSRLDGILGELGLPGMVVIGDDAREPFAGPLLGRRPDEAFLSRVRRTLDPHGVFSATARRHD